MATYKKRNPRKVEADLRGISTSWAQVGRLYSADGTLPNDSEHFGNEVLDYVASIINDVNTSSEAGLRLFDSDTFRTGDGYGGRNWDLTDVYNPDVINAYGPLVSALTNGGTQEFFSTNGGLRPARIKDHYNLVVTDSDGVMSAKNVYTIFKLYFDDFMANDFFARKALADKALDGTAADSDLAARLFAIVNTEAGDASDAFRFPIGTTLERPAPPGPGMVRFNTDQVSFEGYDGNAWSSLGGVMDVDQDTYITAETNPTTDEDELTFVVRGGTAALLDSEGMKISNLAGTGTRNVTVDASGNLTTATPTAQIALQIYDSTGVVLKTLYGNAV